MSKPVVEIKKVTDFRPDPANANKGTERGLRILDDSIAETGLGRSIVVDKNGLVIAGNKTQERATDSGLDDAIVVHTDGKQLVVVQRDDLDLSDATGTARKLAYYDNRASELGLEWDTAQILADINTGLDLSALFRGDELDSLLEEFAGADILQDDNLYSREVESPAYEPSRQKPSIDELFDDSKTRQLIHEIEQSDLPEDEKHFLKIAAQRHTVLNFSKIADYYAHSNPGLQHLMENSALVIIDFNRAIELGFVKLVEGVAELQSQDDD